MKFKHGVTTGVVLLLLASLSIGLARDGGDHGDHGGGGGGNSGEYHGGFVMSDSLDGVNPVYHPRVFGFKKQVFVPQPESYCFVHGPNGWYVDCNANSPASMATRRVVHEYAKVTPEPVKTRVVRKPLPIAPTVVHRPPANIDNRIVSLPRLVFCPFCQ